MPIFEYVCQTCGHRFEALQKAEDAPLVTCPKCRKHKLKKALSAPAFHLHGTGWRSPSRTDKVATGAQRTTRRIGHMLDSGPPHTHDDDNDTGSLGGDTHTHGGVAHTHSPGGKHKH